MQELRHYAQTVALEELNAAEADDLRGFLVLDRDGDGQVILEEVAAAVQAAQIDA